MQRAPVSWKLSEEKAVLFIRTLKYMHTVGETITFIVRPDRLELYNESSDNCAVLIATFKAQFFNEFQGTASRIFAIFSKNLTLITDPQKTSIIGLWFLYRNEEYLDIVINYNTGVCGSYACPITDMIHVACEEGGPVLPLYEAWIADTGHTWSQFVTHLFPGDYNYFAIDIKSTGLALRIYDYEKNGTGNAGHPISVPLSMLQFYSPLSEMELVSIPYPRLKSFIEFSKKSCLGLHVLPEHDETTSQATWQGFRADQTAYISMVLGCEIRPKQNIKKEEEEDLMDIRTFRSAMRRV